MGLLKLQQNEALVRGNGRGPLHFGRAHIDGMPFRGAKLPLLREEEFEQALETVYDAKSETFNLSIPEQKAKHDQVLDHCFNGCAYLQTREYKWHTQPDGVLVMMSFLV